MKDRVKGNIEDLKKRHDSLVAADDSDIINQAISGRVKPLTFTKQRMSEILGVTPDNVQPYIDQLESDGEFIVRGGGNRVSLNREQARTIVERFGYKSVPEKRRENPDSFELPVVLVNVAKGGVGKTHTSIHLAVEAANDIKKNRRVLLCDADVQGSLRHYLSHTAGMTSSLKSIRDLIKSTLGMSREERLNPENQKKFAEHLFNEVILSSYVDNLYFIPSVITDSEIPINISCELGNGRKNEAFSVFKDVVIEPLREHFDLVMIDTGPSPDTYMTATLYASNFLLIPTTARKQDYRAYVQYLMLLTIVLEQLVPDDYDGLHAIRTIITKHQNKQEYDAVANRVVAEGDCFATRILENKKYEESSTNNTTLQSFNTSNTKGYTDALNTIRSLYGELDSILSIKEFRR